MSKFLLVLFCFFYFSHPLAAAAPRSNEQILNDMAQATIEGHIRPGYRLLKQATDRLSLSMRTFCKNPNAGPLGLLHQDFSNTVRFFSFIEHIRFGPMTKAYRLERFAYWPDRKGRGARAVRALLKSQDKSALSADTLAQKSIAVQGLTALEILLYAPDTKLLEKSTPAGIFQCGYAQAIVKNLSNIAKNVQFEWREGGEISFQLLLPGRGQSPYRTRKEVTQEFYQTIVSGFKRLVDLKMKPALGKDSDHAKPKRVAFWRSGLALETMQTNLGGLQHFIHSSGFLYLLVDDNVDLQAHVKRVYQEIKDGFNTFTKNGSFLSINKVLTDQTHRSVFEKLIAKFSHLNAGFARQFAVAAELPLGLMHLMEIDRRFFLGSTLALTAWLMCPFSSKDAVGEPSQKIGDREQLFAAARKHSDGTYAAALFSLAGDVRSIDLPARGHDVAVRPGTQEVVAFARRPGRFAVCFSANQGQKPTYFYARPGRHFYGHGVFSHDGRLLYTTENDFETGDGIIGVWDATGDYRWVGEFSAHGIGPHDLALLDDGVTLVVANGGTQTHPESGRQILNLAEMEPSLVYINVQSGDLIEKVVLPKTLRQLSIRHLSVAKDNRVVFGCQYKGATSHTQRLIGMHDRGREIRLSSGPDDVLAGLKNYIGSVCVDRSGEIVAASSPRGNVITFWQASDGRYLGKRDLKDGCGVARTQGKNNFLLTTGEGLATIGGTNGLAMQRIKCFEKIGWDNHVVFVDKV